MQGRSWLRMGQTLVLALVLLLMQQAGLRHALQHAANDDAHAAHTICCECVAHHAADHLSTPHVLVLRMLATTHAAPDAPRMVLADGEVQTAYWARAPPLRQI